MPSDSRVPAGPSDPAGGNPTAGAAGGPTDRPTGLTPVPLAEVATGLDPALAVRLEPGSVDHPADEVALSGAAVRAADCRPGDLFGALPGARVHGAEFAGQAVAAGAVAVLTDAAGRELVRQQGLSVPVLLTEQPRRALGPASAAIYHHPSERLQIIGVTGTSGKTTTCFLLEAALRAQGLTTGLLGTVMTRITEPDGTSTELPSAFTTPEAPDLQALLAVMCQRGVQAVAMEVSSHALQLGRVGGTRYRVGAFANLSQDHLDFHPTMEDYYLAKASLFDGQPAAAGGTPLGAGVSNIDDEYGARLAAEHPSPGGRPMVTISPDGAAADWRLEALTADATGRQQLQIAGPDGLALQTELGLPGPFNAGNALLALACVHAAGYTDPSAIQAAAQALSAVQVPGRMQRVDAGQDFLAVVDYAHKPAAVRAVLTAVRASVPGRVIVALGAGGDRDAGKRPLMGQAAVELADVVIVTDDNPRSEVPHEIRAAVLEGAHQLGEDELGEARLRADTILEIGDRAEAIAMAVALAGHGDAVVIAGKGHETGQEIDGVKHPFSDLRQLESALGARSGAGGVGSAAESAGKGESVGKGEAPQ
ncbi:UDP-N-acetylmuramoyl-L-alanyl-D-glutamate--2,6-diaminopimelate ligase [Nakamurella aerolata]|uniref:UDP-N-acetylmuramoyl-L-alanyl-D-glutamate--2,6-diaminopimelate ligase n=1 Tax=Nakamurella aerolata TaxID=1656892 RepID=A0A849A6A9_9ACTN|nr:UDP-N-acetylmuramoyl-L-alanyl-D-glutamate--2,6-diaminopimelate ligase [Nakamurella aerolata]